MLEQLRFLTSVLFHEAMCIFFIFGNIIKPENLISIDLKVTGNFNLSCSSADGEANLESLILISSTSEC